MVSQIRLQFNRQSDCVLPLQTVAFRPNPLQSGPIPCSLSCAAGPFAENTKKTKLSKKFIAFSQSLNYSKNRRITYNFSGR